MRNLIVLTILLVASISMSAQRPDEGNTAVSFGVQGLADLKVKENASAVRSLLIRYYLSQITALRLGGRLSVSSFTETDDQATTSGLLYIDKERSTKLGIALGIQRALGSHERLEPYYGADAGLSMMSSGYTNRVEVVDDSRASGTNGDYSELVVKDGTGFRFSIIPFVGFNYYFATLFAIGAEFGCGFGIYNQGAGLATSTVKIGNDIDINEVATSKSSEVFLGKKTYGRLLITFAF